MGLDLVLLPVGWLRRWSDSCKLIEWGMALNALSVLCSCVPFIYHHSRYDLVNIDVIVGGLIQPCQLVNRSNGES